MNAQPWSRSPEVGQSKAAGTIEAPDMLLPGRNWAVEASEGGAARWPEESEILKVGADVAEALEGEGMHIHCRALVYSSGT